MAKAKFGRDGQRKLAPHAIVVFKKGFDVFYIAKHIRDKATNRRETYLCELIQWSDMNGLVVTIESAYTDL